MFDRADPTEGQANMTRRDLLEQLGNSDVPPVPRELRRSVHDKLNVLLMARSLR